MYKIAVLGDKDSIYGFAALGLDIYPVPDAVEGAKKLKTLADGNYAVIYLTEGLAAELTHELNHLRKLPLPAIIPIPGLTGNTGVGMQMVKKSVEQAVGSDILFGGDATMSEN